MDIKITQAQYDQFKSLDITKSFQELDVDGDGKITKDDLKAAKDSQIAAQINSLLNAADDDPELALDSAGKTGASKGAKTNSANPEKTAAGKNKYGLTELDSSNYDEEVTNKKGTVYILYGAIGRCGRCSTLQSAVQKRFDEISAKASVVSLNCDEQGALCAKLKSQINITGNILPFIIKVVDGKPVEQIPYDGAATVDTMIAKAEGTPAAGGTGGTGGTTGTEGAGATAGAGATGGTSAADQAKIATLTTEIADLDKQIKELEDANTDLKAQKEDLEAQKAAAEKELQDAKDDLADEQDKLDGYVNEYGEVKEEVDILNKSILREQNREEEEYTQSMEELTNKALEEYDPEKDGDNFESYLAAKMDGAGLAVFTKLNDLNAQAEGLSDKAKNLLKNISSQTAAVYAAQKRVKTATTKLDAVTADLDKVNADIDANDKKIADLTATKTSKENEKKALEKSGSSSGSSGKCEPLVFDVNGDGVKTTDETINYDIDGDGQVDVINNTSDYVLAFDADGDGISGEDGKEIFGDNADLDGDGVKDGYKDGYEVLKALGRQYGLIGGDDNTLDANDLKFLEKEVGLTMKKGYTGESQSFAELGVTEINLGTTTETKTIENYDGKGNDLMTQEGSTFKVNGETHDYADIWHLKKGTAAEATPQADSLAKAAKKENEAKFAEVVMKDGRKLALGLNSDKVLAVQGKVDAKAIQEKAKNKAEAPEIPDELLKEVVELEEEE